MRSREPGSDRVRVVPELRRLVEFRRLNFMDADYGIAEKVGCDLLPQRDHLLRPAHAGAHSAEALAATWCRADTCLSVTPRPCTIWIFRLRRWPRLSTGGSMPEPDGVTAGGLCAAGRIAPGDGADDSAHRARLLCRHRVPGSAAGPGRALPSHAAAIPGKPAATAEPLRRAPLRGLCHSRSGPAVRCAGRAAAARSR